MQSPGSHVCGTSVLAEALPAIRTATAMASTAANNLFEVFMTFFLLLSLEQRADEEKCQRDMRVFTIPFHFTEM
jgi:hypothetical protein